MAPSRISTVFFLLLTTAILTTAIPPPEYNSLLSALRSRNYDLFADAISTTEIQSDIISGRNLTVFVPIDASPFPSDYINTVRYHIVPNYRLTASDLRKLPYGPNSYPTLVRRRRIYLINNWVGLPVSYNGVSITVPDLYHDKNVVVHGIEEMAEFHHFPDRSKLRRPSTTFVNPKPKYLAVAGVASFGSEVVAPQIRVDSISDPHYRSESAQRHLSELNIKDVSTRGEDDFDEFGTGTISENQLAVVDGEQYSRIDELCTPACAN